MVVLAGLGSMRGLASAFLGGTYREIVALGAFLLILLLRPQGLFGRTDA